MQTSPTSCNLNSPRSLSQKPRVHGLPLKSETRFQTQTEPQQNYSFGHVFQSIDIFKLCFLCSCIDVIRKTVSNGGIITE
jgi:hypothetical protein